MSTIYKRGGTWYYQTEDADREAEGLPRKRRFSLKTTDERTARTLQTRADFLEATGRWDPWAEDLHHAVKGAERKQRQRELERMARAPSDHTAAVLLSRAIEGFTSRKDLRTGTRRTYAAVLSHMLKHVETGPDGLPERKSLGEWLRSGSEGREATYARTLRAFERWGAENGYLPDPSQHGTESFVPPTRAKNAGRLVYFTAQEIEAIVAYIEAHESVEQRLWLVPIIRTAVYTGLRLAEHAKARAAWYDGVTQHLTVPAADGKADRDDRIYVPAAAAAVLEEQVERSRTGRLFELGGGPFTPGHLSNRFRDVKEAAGVEKGSFHTLRHTCASWLAQGGAPAYAIKRHMRHANIQTTERYMHLGPQHQEALVEQAFERHDELYGVAD